MTKQTALFGFLAEFATGEQLLDAARKTQQAGYTATDSFAPFPLNGLDEAMKLPRSKIPTIVFIGGILVGLSGFLMQVYSCVYSYPLNVGGRPHYSWPAFIPLTFELTVLGAGLSAAFGMLALNRLPQPYHPLFNIPAFDRASTDRFFLCIETADPQFNLQSTRQFLESLGAIQIYEVPE
jgi:hypothetical protein